MFNALTLLNHWKSLGKLWFFWIRFYGILIDKNPYFCVVTKIFSLIAKILLTVQIVSLIQLKTFKNYFPIYSSRIVTSLWKVRHFLFVILKAKSVSFKDEHPILSKSTSLLWPFNFPASKTSKLWLFNT